MGRTIGSTLNALLGTTLKSTGGILTTTPNAPVVAPKQQGSSSAAAVQKARSLLAQAAADFGKAQSDLKSDDLGAYQKEIAAAQAATAQAASILNGQPSSSNAANGALSNPRPQSSGASASTTSAVSARTSSFFGSTPSTHRRVGARI
jgi:hypothetical protein